MPIWSVAKNCMNTSIGFTPSNYIRDELHTLAGISAKIGIVPRSSGGIPNSLGYIGMIGIGMSNAKQIHNKFYQIMEVTFGGDKTRHPAFRFVNASQNGKTAESWSIANNNVWTTAQTYVINRGLTRWQIQAASVIMTQKYPLTYGAMTSGQMQQILNNLINQFPNIQIIYLSGINYTGYSNDPTLPLVDQTRAPEPFPYYDSLLLADMIGINPRWIDFTDLWADGIITNSLTGLNYICSDVEIDGVHPTAIGAQKIAYSIRDRWKKDPVTKGWMFQ